MTFFEIPLWERFIGDFHALRLKATRCLEVPRGDRKVGLFFYPTSAVEKNFSLAQISQCIIGVGETKCLVEANVPISAIRQFYQKWQGTKVGSKGSKALWINRDKPIVELPWCKRLHKRQSDQGYICGPEVDENGNGEFGGCVLESYDEPEFSEDPCPIAKHQEILRQLEGEHRLPFDMVCGLMVVRVEEAEMTAEMPQWQFPLSA